MKLWNKTKIGLDVIDELVVFVVRDVSCVIVVHD